jgi:hypothetical protein
MEQAIPDTAIRICQYRRGNIEEDREKGAHHIPSTPRIQLDKMPQVRHRIEIAEMFCYTYFLLFPSSN